MRTRDRDESVTEFINLPPRPPEGGKNGTRDLIQVPDLVSVALKHNRFKMNGFGGARPPRFRGRKPRLDGEKTIIPLHNRFNSGPLQYGDHTTQKPLTLIASPGAKAPIAFWRANPLNCVLIL